MFMPSRSEPNAITRSASSHSRPAGSTCGGMPTQHGCSGGSTPRPPYVVSTGAASRSASARTSSARSRAPEPAQISGRAAASMSGVRVADARPASGRPRSSPSMSRSPGPPAGPWAPRGTTARREPTSAAAVIERDLVRRRRPRAHAHHRPEHLRLPARLVQHAAIDARPPQRGRDVGRDHEDRRPRRPRLADRPERVRRAGPGRRQRDAEPPGRARVAVRRVRRGLLVAHADEPDRRLAQRLPERQVVDARQPEADLHARVLELRHDRLRSGRHRRHPATDLILRYGG